MSVSFDLSDEFARLLEVKGDNQIMSGGAISFLFRVITFNGSLWIIKHDVYTGLQIHQYIHYAVYVL